MSVPTTSLVPVYIPALARARLEALARADKVAVGSKLAELVDLACSVANIEVANSLVQVQMFGESCAIDLLHGEYRVALTRLGAKTLAADLFTVADRGGTIASVEHDYIVRKTARSVVLEIDALAKTKKRIGSRRTTLAKSLPLDLAREIASALLIELNRWSPPEREA